VIGGGVGCENSNKINEIVYKKKNREKKKLRATSVRDKCEKKNEKRVKCEK
jgi:hypothetical protein